MVKTLNDAIGLLKPKQQEYIVSCVQQYTERKDMHRGLLPFLEAVEAARVLKFKLESLKPSAFITEDAGVAVAGERFIREIISIVERGLEKQICEDEASVEMQLNTAILARHFRGRYEKKFCAMLAETAQYYTRDMSLSLVQLEMTGKDRWKITCHRLLIDKATTWLADNFREKKNKKQYYKTVYHR